MPSDVYFEFVDAVTTAGVPYLLCYCCGMTIPSGKTALCYVGGENPLYAYICELCKDIFGKRE